MSEIMKRNWWFWLRFPIYIIADIFGIQNHWDKYNMLKLVEAQNAWISKLEARIDLLEKADALLEGKKTIRRN